MPEIQFILIVVFAVLIGLALIALVFFIVRYLKRPNYRVLVTRVRDVEFFCPQVRLNMRWYNLMRVAGTYYLSSNQDTQLLSEIDCVKFMSAASPKRRSLVPIGKYQKITFGPNQEIRYAYSI